MTGEYAVPARPDGAAGRRSPLEYARSFAAIEPPPSLQRAPAGAGRRFLRCDAPHIEARRTDDPRNPASRARAAR